MDEELDSGKIKYVLYVRKSTTDEARQVRSIPDQISDCQERIIKPRHLRVIDTLQETKSAKIPKQRPIFTQMLKDIRRGKYDGIVSWNPDRLARNMLEGGEIIDMVDQNIIKDLKFVNHYFTKDANGKMLLGMAFVLSKQYSDDLSQKVTRGVRKSFEEGKSAIPKYGYIRTDEGMYKPDDSNFEIVCAAWHMRKKGYSLEDIVKYMDEKGFYRLIKSTGEKQKITEQKLSRMFSDPFYYGILVQKDQTVDLRSIYNFTPAVSEEDYWMIQNITNIRPTYSKSRTFYPFKRLILCSYCNQPMYIGPSTGESGKRYLNARCDNKLCSRKKKSVRVKVFLDFIYKFLEEGLNFTEKEYKDYYTKMIYLTEQKKENLRINLHNKQGLLKQVHHERDERSWKIIKLDENNPIYKANERKINDLQAQSDELEDDINKIKIHLNKAVEDNLTLEDFLNYSKEASTIVKVANPIAKDQICKKIFLNLTVDEEKVTSYQLKPPFDTLLKNRQILSGRDGET